jgi:hypothetical protein
MKRTKMVFAALLMMGAASGCTRDNVGLAPLDQPAEIKASGAQPASMLTMYRKGVLDPAGSLTTLDIRDATVRVTTLHDKATVQELVFKLADANMPATESMPQGVNLRNQELHITRRIDAPMVQREENAVTVRAHTTLTYKAAMVLDDGSLYTLGGTESEPVDLDIRATRYEFGVHVIVDAAPQGKCWSIPGVLEVSDCSLFVETDGDAFSH